MGIDVFRGNLNRITSENVTRMVTDVMFPDLAKVVDFDTTRMYYSGDLVYRLDPTTGLNKIYKCKSNKVSAGAFNASDWYEYWSADDIFYKLASISSTYSGFNADTVDGKHASDLVLATDVVTTATANKILKLDANSKLPASITGNADGNAATATKWATARTVSITGDATWTTTLDGSANATAALSLATTGVSAGTYTKVTVDTKGRVTAGASLVLSDLPSIDWTKLINTPTTLSGYGITDALSSTGSLNITGSTTFTQGSMIKKELYYIGVQSGDYVQTVILLHPIYNGTAITENYCIGTIYGSRGGIGTSSRQALARINTKSAYNTNNGSIESENEKFTLVTCTYNSVAYMAIKLPYSAPFFSNGVYFDGLIKSSGAESLKLIDYYNQNTSTVLNTEVNTSISTFTPNNSTWVDTTSATFAGSVTINGGTVSLGNGTANTLKFAQAGISSPTSSGGSGMKVDLWNDGRYSIGMDTGTVWYTSGASHKWYSQNGSAIATPTVVMTLDGTGVLTTTSLISTNPNSTTDSVALNWNSNVPRIRVGGSGTYSNADFQIQGASDAVRMSVGAGGVVTLPVAGANLRIGATTGGTYNGNIYEVSADQFPYIAYRNSTTIKSMVMADVNTGSLYLDTSGSFIVRNAPNTGSNILSITNAGVITTKSNTALDDGSGNIALNGSTYTRITSSTAMTGTGQGGILQFSGTADSVGGYGAWLNYNAYYNGTSWKQPRGSLSSYAYTTNYHLGFAWLTAAATNTDNGDITLVKVAGIDNSGNFSGRTLTSTVAQGTAPLAVTSTTLVSNLNAQYVNGYTASMGNTASTTAVRDANKAITAAQFISDVATGTAPLTVVSTTKVTNLNADLVDGFNFDQSVKTTDSPTFVGLTLSTLNGVPVSSKGIRAVSVEDTRAAFEIPFDKVYQKYGVSFDFKGGSANTEVSDVLSALYAGVMTVAAWANSSGGFPHQLAFGADRRIYHRIGLTAAKTTWTASTAKALNDMVQPTTNNGHFYKCTTAGTTGTTEPTWPTTSGATVTDGTSVWTEVGKFWDSWNKIAEEGTTPSFSSVNISSTGSLNQLVSTDQAYSWSRGTFFKTYDGATTLGGVGMYGNSATPSRMFIGFGSSPETVGQAGIYVTTAGLVTTKANTLDDGTGNATFAGNVTVPSVSLGGYSAEKHVGTFSTTASTSNQKIDLYYTGSFYGIIDISVTGGWNGQNNSGKVKKRIAVVHPATTTISAQSTRYEEVIGFAGSRIAISDVTWDSTNNRWRIQIAYLGTSASSESFIVQVSAFSAYTTSISNITAATLGTIYTTDTTVFAAPIISFPNAVTHAGQIISTVATGTAPFTVASTTQVDNLNANYLKGYDASLSGTANTVAVRTSAGMLSATAFNSRWQSLSSGGDGVGLLGHNAYYDYGANVYKYQNTHASLGARGIVFRWDTNAQMAQPLYFNMGNVATTADATFTPTLYKMWHEGNDGSGSGLDADTVRGFTTDQNIRTTDSPTFAGITVNGTSYIGDSTNGWLRVVNNSTAIYLQAITGDKTGSKTLYLTGLNGATTGVRTYNNVIDDSSGAAIFAGPISVTRGTAAGGYAHYALKSTAGVARYAIGLTGVETGTGNTGADLGIWTYADDGSLIAQGLKIIRSSGALYSKLNTLDDGAGNATFNGVVTLNNATSNLLKFNTAGVATPTATGGSGMKIDLYNGEYGIGIEGSSVWYTSDTNHKWYSQNGSAGTPTNVMTLDGNGNLTTTGKVTAPSVSLNDYSIDKHVGTFTTTAIANQKIDLYFTGTFSGSLDVSITGGYNTYDSTGKITKTFSINVSSSTTINSQNSRYSEVIGAIGSRIAISDVTWDSTNNRWRIQIAQLDSVSANKYTVVIKASTNTSSMITNVSSATLGTIYTTDTTVFAAPVISFPNAVTHGGQIISTVATGTAPFAVASTTTVTNLSADLLDGFHATTSGMTANSIAVRDGNSALSSAQFISSIPTGTAPLSIASTTLVTNLNADMVDGYHVSVPAANSTIAVRDSYGAVSALQFVSTVSTGTMPLSIASTTLVTNLNADMVDGYHTSTTAAASKIPVYDANAQIPGTAPMVNNVTTLPATAGWYRIATSGASISRCAARFEVDWYVSGVHGQVTFNASVMYGISPTINIIQYSTYASNAGITQVRMVYHTTYSGNYAYLEVYNSGANAIQLTTQMFSSIGWSIITPTAGSIPTGYSNLTVNCVTGISTTGQLASYVATGTAPMIVSSTTKVANLNADLLDGYDTATAANASTVAVRDASGDLYAVSQRASTGVIVTGGDFTKALGTITVPAGTSNAKFDLYFPANTTVSGVFDISVVGGWNYFNATGRITKRFSFNGSSSGTINTQSTNYEEAIGTTRGYWGISDVSWDSTNSRWRVQIAFLGTTNSSYTEYATVIISGNSITSAYQATLYSAALGSIYTTDTAVLANPTVSSNSDVIMNDAATKYGSSSSSHNFSFKYNPQTNSLDLIYT